MTKDGSSIEIQSFGEGVFSCSSCCMPVFKSEAEEEIFRIESEKAERLEKEEQSRKAKKREKIERKEKENIHIEKSNIKQDEIKPDIQNLKDKKPVKFKRIFGFLRRKEAD